MVKKQEYTDFAKGVTVGMKLAGKGHKKITEITGMHR